MNDEVIDISEVEEEQARGVNLSCVADVSPADLIESALNLIQQVTRAVLNNSTTKRAADLGLGDDQP